MGVRLAFLLFCFLGFLQISTSSPAPAKEATEGILLSGGRGAEKSVEVFVPSTGESCSLPSLPDERSYHTMDGTTICGGYKAINCISFSSGRWSPSSLTVEQRVKHSSWKTDQGILLMSGHTSEMISGNLGVPSFDMEKNIEFTCAMQDLASESVILSGGAHSGRTVSRYDLQGFVEDLPELNVGRNGHGCGAFLRGDGTQVFMVAGGFNFNYPSQSMESSTEMLTTGSSAWTMATPLPTEMWALRGATVGNVLYMTAGYDGTQRDQILSWVDEEQEWKEVGKLNVGRDQHDATTILLEDPAMEYCV